jgi:hypothetical protein
MFDEVYFLYQSSVELKCHRCRIRLSGEQRLVMMSSTISSTIDFGNLNLKLVIIHLCEIAKAFAPARGLPFLHLSRGRICRTFQSLRCPRVADDPACRSLDRYGHERAGVCSFALAKIGNSFGDAGTDFPESRV